jgi:bifunctional UDP-N-acetylglucosamine pyrophosphorylase/glucosamine-1-phosphate N-acetyltransferase
MEVIVLAAGQGKRMRSVLPKVLQPLAAKPMLAHVLDTARTLEARRIVVVYGHGGEVVREALDAPDLAWARQDPPQGTGHAVQQAMPLVEDGDTALILYGDVPLIGVPTLQRLMAAASDTALALLTVSMDNPTGYGRILRDGAGKVTRIVEEKDATADERQVREVNTGILAAPVTRLRQWLGKLKNDNAQGEYYLTDIIAMAVADGLDVVTTQPDAFEETLGVNNKTQLAELERIHQRNIARRLTDAGVTVIDPARLDVRGSLECGRDVEIDINCVFEGTVVLGDGVRIGANCIVRNATLGAGTRVAPFSQIEDTITGEACIIGPYARTRPGTVLGNDVHLGNFVEVKNSTIADHSKANHLAYVGDADIGQRVNVGAGTITCNYDGANKFRTVIEDDVFIGSDTQLVAPVRVGKGATLGAGTTLTKDAPAEQLTVSRAKQISPDRLAAPGQARSDEPRGRPPRCPRLAPNTQHLKGPPPCVASLPPLPVATSFPCCSKACASSNTGATTPPASPCSRTASCSACAPRPRRRACRPGRCHPPERRDRHRPHPLGHPRRALRAQRPPPHLRRPRRGA